MNAVAKHEEGQVVDLTPQPASEAAGLMAVITAAATNTAIDPDKLEKLMGLYERISDRNAKASYNTALAALQPTLPVITAKGKIVVPAKDGKVGHETPYARWEDINDAIRPPLFANGFALSFRIGTAQDGKITVTGILSHREGHSEETTITLMHDASGSKNSVQAVGSSVSYGKRYTAMALLNITSRAPQDADDDGHTADPACWITVDQLGELQEMMESVGADREKFLNFFRIETIAHLPKTRFDEAVKMLQAKAKR